MSEKIESIVDLPRNETVPRGSDPLFDAYVDAYFDAEFERWLDEEDDRRQYVKG